MISNTLFTISKSWHDSTWLFEQLAFAKAGDCILLIQDAVLAAQSPITLASFLAKCTSNEIEVCVLQDDIRLRGVSNQYTNLTEIDYPGFVELVAQYSKQVAW